MCSIPPDGAHVNDRVLSLTPPVRAALSRARRRYHAARPPGRPTLNDPTSYVGLFPLADLLALARACLWPLPPPVLAWLADPPAVRARRRRRHAGRLAALLWPRLARELPAALARLNRRAVP